VPEIAALICILGGGHSCSKPCHCHLAKGEYSSPCTSNPMHNMSQQTVSTLITHGSERPSSVVTTQLREPEPSSRPRTL
jgi:hypothetical protein